MEYFRHLCIPGPVYETISNSLSPSLELAAVRRPSLAFEWRQTLPMLRATVAMLILGDYHAAHAFSVHSHVHKFDLRTSPRAPAAISRCVEVYSSPQCRHCDTAKNFLDTLGVAYTEIDVTANELNLGTMLVRTHGASSVPQVFIDDRYVGGCTDMLQAAEGGTLFASEPKSPNPVANHALYHDGLARCLAKNDQLTALPV